MKIKNKLIRLIKRPLGFPSEDTWKLDEEILSPLNENEILIENHYISFDPAMRGWLNETRSYIEPVKIGEVMRAGSIGKVLESKNSKFSKGDIVSGWAGVQQYSINNGKGFFKISPGNIDLPVFLGTLGMPGMTAYFGLLDVLKPKENETLVVSGAAGAVGSLVSQIAKIKGCKVIGIAGSEEKCNWLKNDLKVDGVIDYKTDNLNSKLKELCPDGIDMYFDNVGGEITEAVINRFNIGGRMSICGQISGYNSETLQPGPRNWINILVKRLKIQGFIVFDYQARAKEAFVDMSKWMAEGKLQHKNHIVDGLENAVTSLKMLFSGENKGKMIVKISDE